MQEVFQRAANLFELLASDPQAGADELDRMAAQLKALATHVRGNPLKSIGGMTDRVQMELVGPDGVIKRRIDTGA